MAVDSCGAAVIGATTAAGDTAEADLVSGDLSSAICARGSGADGGFIDRSTKPPTAATNKTAPNAPITPEIFCFCLKVTCKTFAPYIG
jgi:hypothetical protein